jgi:hypothetical protein
LSFRQGWRAAEYLASCLGPLQPGLGPLDQQVPLKLRDGVDDAHRHAACRAREVDSVQGEAVNPHAHVAELGDRRGDVDRVPAQPVQLGDDQHVILLQLVQQFDETRPLLDCRTTGHGFGDDATRIHFGLN